MSLHLTGGFDNINNWRKEGLWHIKMRGARKYDILLNSAKEHILVTVLTYSSHHTVIPPTSFTYLKMFSILFGIIYLRFGSKKHVQPFPPQARRRPKQSSDLQKHKLIHLSITTQRFLIAT